MKYKNERISEIREILRFIENVIKDKKFNENRYITILIKAIEDAKTDKERNEYKKRLNNFKSIFDIGEEKKLFDFIEKNGYNIEDLKEKFAEEYLIHIELEDILRDIDILKEEFEELSNETENEKSQYCILDEINILELLEQQIKDINGVSNFEEHINYILKNIRRYLN